MSKKGKNAWKKVITATIKKYIEDRLANSIRLAEAWERSQDPMQPMIDEAKRIREEEQRDHH